MPHGLQIVWNRDEVVSLVYKLGREKALGVLAGDIFKTAYIEEMVRRLMSPMCEKEVVSVPGEGTTTML